MHIHATASALLGSLFGREMHELSILEDQCDAAACAKNPQTDANSQKLKNDRRRS